MNQELHWNNIASKYKDEVFDVFRSDKNKKLQTYFKKHADVNKEMVDFGCGIGNSFDFTAPHFKNILAVDISGECIKVAKTNPYSNITFKRVDLTKKNLGIPPADFILCCNVALLADIDMDRAIFKNIEKTLRPNGSAIVVIPSMESVLFSSWRLVDLYKKEGVKPEKIPTSELNYYKGKKTDLVQGVIYINGVPTKHYSQQELQVLFEEAGLQITALEKLEYDWTTEFSEPPEWMKAPYPWDWMVECRKM